MIRNLRNRLLERGLQRAGWMNLGHGSWSKRDGEIHCRASTEQALAFERHLRQFRRSP